MSGCPHRIHATGIHVPTIHLSHNNQPFMYGQYIILNLGGGFQHVLFLPLPDKMIQFDLRIFFKWVGKNHQLEIHGSYRFRKATSVGEV